MDRRLLVVGFALAVLGMSRAASAAPKDAAALKVEKDAIYNDYLATKFTDAERKLKQALDMCKKNACSNKVVAQLHRDLGIVYTVGIKRLDEAKREFAEALRADPGVTLIKDLTTPEIEQAFEAAKGGGGGAAEPREAPKTSAVAAGGDIVHTPPSEQAVLTPVPIYAEMPEGVIAAKVQVKYKGFGATEWKTKELSKVGDGWGIELPCLDVGTTTGDLKYFLQAYDASGDAVAMSGTRNAPHVVPIRNELSGEPPRLPDRPAPAQCADPNACPPGLPGCKKERRVRKHGNKDRDAMCEDTTECKEGLACKVGVCVTDETYIAGGAHSCTTSDECEAGQACNDGVCGVPLEQAKQNWFSIAIQQDMLFLPSSNDACSGNETTYQCFRPDDTWFDPTDPSATLRTDKGNQVAGGIGRATLRVLLGYDRLLGSRFTIGARLGFAFGGGPTLPDLGNGAGKAFMPLHLEGRAAYWFGSTPFMRSGLRVYGLAAAGMAQIDAAVGVNVYEYGYTDPEKVNAWRKTGNLFAGLGIGAQYAVTVGQAIFAELKAQDQLGTSGMALTLQLGYAMGH